MWELFSNIFNYFAPVADVKTVVNGFDENIQLVIWDYFKFGGYRNQDDIKLLNSGIVTMSKEKVALLVADLQLRDKLQKKYNSDCFNITRYGWNLTEYDKTHYVPTFLLDAVCTNHRYVGTRTFKTYTDEIGNDILEIIRVIPETLDYSFGYIRCRNLMSPLELAVGMNPYRFR